jgi:ubiquitin-protein ligase
MENIRRPWLTWRIVSGAAPFVEEYELQLQLRTIIGPKPEYRDKHVIRVSLGTDYPIGKPVLKMLTRPPPFHPNWWRTGLWCSGKWHVYESIGAHIVRMIQTLQYDSEITQDEDSANLAARNWYRARRGSSLFPCDQTPLPDPTGALTRPQVKKKFQVRLKDDHTESSSGRIGLDAAKSD